MNATLEETAPLPRPSALAPRPRLVLAVAVAAIVAAGVWGTSAQRSEHHDHAAGVGTDVALAGGGGIRVDRVGDVDVGRMDMPMSGPGMALPAPRAAKMPEVPKGQRRVGVDLTIRAGATDDPVHFLARDVRLVASSSSAGIEPAAADVLDEVLPPGTAFSTNLAYNVPKSARELELRFPGAEEPITLTLGPAPARAHHH